MTSDPIADMLTRIRNALMVGKPTCEIPTSKIKVEIARILKEEGYIEDYTVGDEKPFSLITINLKYHGARRERKPVISSIQRVSKPGHSPGGQGVATCRTCDKLTRGLSCIAIVECRHDVEIDDKRP